ncbi:MAG: hypothetical protein FJY77_03670 [Candidatus Altiarchaeales archaeon]|nr:hypothetical protein [Candidatus Altiarchaeales archaeon]
MNTEDNEKLRRYVEAVIIPRMNTDNIKYPIRDSRINHLFLAEYTKEFTEDLDELKNKGYSHKDIGLLFRNPTRLMRMAHLLLKGAKLAGYSTDEQKNLILEILKIIESIKHGNIFNEDKRNIILSPIELDKKMKEKDFTKTNKEKSTLVQRLCGMLWAYSEAPYFVAHDIGMEQHGLYKLKSKKVMFRDYFNLKPVELWGECNSFPHNEIQIICIYNKNLQIDFDVFYNTYPNHGNTVDDLEEYHMQADGRTLRLEEAKDIIETAGRVIQSISAKIENWGEKETAKKYADIYWYRKKPLRDALNKNWKPPKKVYENIENGEIKSERTKNPTPEDIRKEMGLT